MDKEIFIYDLGDLEGALLRVLRINPYIHPKGKDGQLETWYRFALYETDIVGAEALTAFSDRDSFVLAHKAYRLFETVLYRRFRHIPDRSRFKRVKVRYRRGNLRLTFN